MCIRDSGSYDYTSAEPVAIGANGETEIFTDARGHAVTAPLPYGTYIVRETTTPKNYAPVDDFIVTISENLPDTPQVWRVLLDEEFSARLKIVKTDAGTGRVIPIAGAEFSIYDIDSCLLYTSRNGVKPGQQMGLPHPGRQKHCSGYCARCSKGFSVVQNGMR